jgi:hypothetical protein
MRKSAKKHRNVRNVARVGDIVRIQSSVSFGKYRDYVPKDLFSSNLIFVSWCHAYIKLDEKEVYGYQCKVMTCEGKISTFFIEKLSMLIPIKTSCRNEID